MQIKKSGLNLGVLLCLTSGFIVKSQYARMYRCTVLSKYTPAIKNEYFLLAINNKQHKQQAIHVTRIYVLTYSFVGYLYNMYEYTRNEFFSKVEFLTQLVLILKSSIYIYKLTCTVHVPVYIHFYTVVYVVYILHVSITSISYCPGRRRRARNARLSDGAITNLFNGTF